MTLGRVVRAATIGCVCASFAIAQSASPEPKGQVVIIKMIDKSATEFVFEPANVVVRSGDVVRFVQTAAMPHNVEFREVPASASLAEAKTGPYLTTPNQTYDVTIDQRFTKGTYNFVCVPHEAMGMKGTITVASTSSK
ncbi:MAG: plastocyanin/azurin family copper-binding protein [Gemmatimonadota bacterium]